METEKSEKKIKSMGFTLKIKENKKKEVKKNSLFDAKNFRKPFEEDVVYNDDIKVKEELIKEVEGRKIHAVHEVEEKGPLIIPLIKTNQWRNQDELKSQDNNDINKKIDKNDDISREKEKDKEINGDQQDEKVKDKKENEEEKEVNIDEKIDLKNKYGLQIPMKKRKLDNEDNNNNNMNLDDNNDSKIEEDNRTLEEKAISALMKEAKMEVDDLGNDSHIKSSIDAIPILKQNAVPGAENLMTETEKFRHDIKYRPEESTLEDYERIPIEEFGAAMLRGMGWEKGKGVGKNRNNNKNTMVSPIEFIPRPALLGLGAQPKPPDLEEMKKRRKRKMMGKEETPKEYKPNITSDGKVRHFKTIDEKINNNNNSRSSSRHRDHDRDRNHSRHRSNSHDYDREHERERERDHKRNHHRHSSHRSDKDKDRGDESDSSSSSSSSINKKESTSYTHSSSSSYTQRHRDRNHRSHSRHHSHRDNDSDDENKPRKLNSWLYPNIRVRIVSKSYKSGKYYKKKGVIFDVNQQGECILRLDNGKLLENVKERYLETLIPAINEIIMVVKHTNTYTDEDYYQKIGKVLSKDRETEKAMIQLEPSMDVALLSFDDICEYKGNTNDFY